MMNLWNPVQIHEMLPAVSIGFLTCTPDNRININNTQLANTIHTLVSQKGLPSVDPATLARARQIVAKQVAQPSFPYRKPTFGYNALWLSEVGRPPTLPPSSATPTTTCTQPGSMVASTTCVGMSGPTPTLTATGRSWTPFPATPQSGTCDSNSLTGGK